MIITSALRQFMMREKERKKRSMLKENARS
jgi:hypothetical protein